MFENSLWDNRLDDASNGYATAGSFTHDRKNDIGCEFGKFLPFD